MTITSTTLRAFASVTCGAVAIGCSNGSSCGDTSITRSDPTVDFTAIRTFAELPDELYPDEVPDDLPEDIETSLETANAAAREQLLSFGLTEVDFETGDPDVVLFSAAATMSETGVSWVCVGGFVWWGGWGFVWDPCAWLRPIEVTITTGSLIVGLAEEDIEDAVFGGLLQGVLNCGDVERRITNGVRRIFSNYPVDQTGS